MSSSVHDLIHDLEHAGIKWWATEDGALACRPEVTSAELRERIAAHRTGLLVVASIRQTARMFREVTERLDAIEARLGPSKEDVARERAIAKGLRFDVLKRDGFKCTYCGGGGNERTLRVDHVVPVSKGGKSTFANLTTACEPCNAGKSDKVVELESKPAKARVVFAPPAPRPRPPVKGQPMSEAEMEAAAKEIMAMLNDKTEDR